MSESLEDQDHLRKKTGTKVTMTHLVGVAVALTRAPGLDGTIRSGKYGQRDTKDVAFLAVLEGGKALLKEAAELGVTDIAQSLRDQASRLRDGKDSDFEESKGLEHEPVKAPQSGQSLAASAHRAPGSRRH